MADISRLARGSGLVRRLRIRRLLEIFWSSLETNLVLCRESLREILVTLHKFKVRRVRRIVDILRLSTTSKLVLHLRTRRLLELSKDFSHDALQKMAYIAQPIPRMGIPFETE
jgi:hypothetical protein